MCALVRVGDVARHLPRVRLCAPAVRKHRGRAVARLRLQRFVVDGAAVEAGRCAGLEPAHSKRQLPQACRQGIGRGVARAPALVVRQTDVYAPAQKRAGGEHHGARTQFHPHLRHHADHALAFDPQIIDRLLKQLEVGLTLQQRPHRRLVQHTIGLGARGAHRCAFARVECTKLNAGAVGGVCHNPAHGVDFLDQVALADAADGRIARHLADGLDIVREQ